MRERATVTRALEAVEAGDRRLASLADTVVLRCAEPVGDFSLTAAAQGTWVGGSQGVISVLSASTENDLEGPNPGLRHAQQKQSHAHTSIAQR